MEERLHRRALRRSEEEHRARGEASGCLVSYGTWGQEQLLRHNSHRSGRKPATPPQAISQPDPGRGNVGGGKQRGLGAANCGAAAEEAARLGPGACAPHANPRVSDTTSRRVFPLGFPPHALKRRPRQISSRLSLTEGLVSSGATEPAAPDRADGAIEGPDRSSTSTSTERIPR